MFRLNFTSKVMGPAGTDRLREQRVTQTLRSPSCNIVRELKYGRLTPGDFFEVALDGEVIGIAGLEFCDRRNGLFLAAEDVERGGFDDGLELEKALKRAGYRFKGVEQYTFYRIRFRWVKEAMR